MWTWKWTLCIGCVFGVSGRRLRGGWLRASLRGIHRRIGMRLSSEVASAERAVVTDLEPCDEALSVEDVPALIDLGDVVFGRERLLRDGTLGVDGRIDLPILDEEAVVGDVRLREALLGRVPADVGEVVHIDLDVPKDAADSAVQWVGVGHKGDE